MIVIATGTVKDHNGELASVVATTGNSIPIMEKQSADIR